MTPNHPLPQTLIGREDRRWVLIGRLPSGECSMTTPIDPLPFSIGRRPDAALTLPRQTVSGVHAEIFQTVDGLFIRDLESTNGTFVNGERVHQAVRIEAGNLVQISDIPFQVALEQINQDNSTKCKDVCDHALALVQFQTLISSSAVIPYYQPIVDLQSTEILAYEVLARSRLNGLETPAAMFQAAEELGMPIPLSQLACRRGVEESWSLSPVPHLFLNTHPDELVSPDFAAWLDQLRELAPTQTLTIEVHEAAVTDIAALSELRRHLDELEMGLAFDDFGAGQARLAELAVIRPDQLKFDRCLIMGLDYADSGRKRFVQSLVHAVNDLGIVALAEGVETQGEADICREMGFGTAQGFFFGRPEPVNAIKAKQEAHEETLSKS